MLKHKKHIETTRVGIIFGLEDICGGRKGKVREGWHAGS